MTAILLITRKTLFGALARTRFKFRNGRSRQLRGAITRGDLRFGPQVVLGAKILFPPSRCYRLIARSILGDTVKSMSKIPTHRDSPLSTLNYHLPAGFFVNGKFFFFRELEFL